MYRSTKDMIFFCAKVPLSEHTEGTEWVKIPRVEGMQVSRNASHTDLGSFDLMSMSLAILET